MRRACLIAALAMLTSGPAGDMHAAIPNIHVFLRQCSGNDPASRQIRADFEILRNGVPVGAAPCTEPIGAMSSENYREELSVERALRTIYHMDRGRADHLPWTFVSLYD